MVLQTKFAQIKNNNFSHPSNTYYFYIKNSNE